MYAIPKRPLLFPSSVFICSVKCFSNVKTAGEESRLCSLWDPCAHGSSCPSGEGAWHSCSPHSSCVSPWAVVVVRDVHRPSCSCCRNAAAVCMNSCLCRKEGRAALVGEFCTKPGHAPPAPRMVLVSLKINNRSQLEEVSQSIHQRQERGAVIQEAKFRL